MARGMNHSPIVRAVNSVAVALIKAPVLGRFVGRGLVIIRYTGRRSGRTFETPVGYRRSGDTITIAVASPDAKSWWRNFLGDGAPITFVGLDGRDRTGHAVGSRDHQGRVAVTVRLDQRR